MPKLYYGDMYRLGAATEDEMEQAIQALERRGVPRRVLFDPTQLAGAEQQPDELLRMPEHRFSPMPGDLEFDEGAETDLAASATATIVSFSLPSHYHGFLRYFGQKVGNAAEWANVRWRLMINGESRVPGYDNIIGPMGSILQPTPVLVVLLYNYSAQLQAVNLSSTATINKVGGRLKGWYWKA